MTMMFSIVRRFAPHLAAIFIGIVAIFSSPSLRAQSLLNYTSSWLGNTGGTEQTHVQQRIDDIYVDTDGTVFTDSGWDEGGAFMGVYRNGVRVSNLLNGGWGWGRSAGYAVTGNSNYIYAGMSESGDDNPDTNLNANGLRRFPDPRTLWYCVARFNKDGSVAPFNTGYGPWGNMLIVNTYTRSQGEQSYPDRNVYGLAANSNTLYVADPSNTRIAFYNTSTLAPLGQWPISRPGHLSLDPSGAVWVLQPKSSGTPAVLKLNGSGQTVSTISFSSQADPTDIAFDSSRLYVSDDGPDLNVKRYNPASLSGSPTTVESTFGYTGGITSGTAGLCGPLKFHNPRGVGVDAVGNIYVANATTTGNEDCVIESYQPSGTPNWSAYGLDWVDCASTSSASENDIYTQDSHYTYNYSAAAGTGWTYKGYTINKNKYPNDLRIRDWMSKAWLRQVGGKPILYVTQQGPGAVVIYRFNTATDGETAIPCGFIARETFSSLPSYNWSPPNQPAGEWIWRDGSDGSTPNGDFGANEYINNGGTNSPISNSDGVYSCVDTNGDIWMTAGAQPSGAVKIRHYKCLGLDQNGSPRYDYATGDTETIDAPGLTGVGRVDYIPATDEMFISGFNAAYPKQSVDPSYSIGRVLLRFAHWSTGNRNVTTSYPLPPADSQTLPMSYSVCGSYLFVGIQSHQQPSYVEVLDKITGAVIGVIKPDSTLGNNIGNIDDANGVDVYQRANGEYVILTEDDGFAKSVMYRWTPKLQIQNRWQGTYINTQNGLACSAINYSWTSADWVQEPTQNGTFRLRNLWTGQYLNVQASGTLQCTSVSPTSTAAMWQLQDANGGYYYLCNLSNGQCINTQSGLACSAINYSWWSAMWQLNEVN